MPVLKEDGQDGLDKEWLLRVLDSRFREQEHAIQQMLDRSLLQLELSVDIGVTTSEKFAVQTSCHSAADGNFVKEPNLIPFTMAPETQAATPPIAADLEAAKIQEKIGSKSVSRKGLDLGSSKRLKSFVHGPLDVAMAVLVCIHLFFMVALIELEEGDSRFSLGLSSEPSDASNWSEFFQISEYVFFCIYLFDVVIRIYALRWGWCIDSFGGLMFMNIFDALLVVLGAFDLFLLPLMFGMQQDSHTRSMRVVKLLRMVRTLRIVKTVAAFRQVRVLIASCMASVGALGWSMVLLFVMQLSFALVICQSLQGFIQDDKADYDARLQLYGLYGSFFRALYTMYEITYSGGWPAVVRPVIEKVSPWYAVPFLLYVALVVFAVIRIVNALFLKETLETTAHDAEIAIENHLHAGSRFSDKLKTLFRAFDSDGDGVLTPQEWESAWTVPYIQHYLHVLDVRIADCRRIFGILDDGDGKITISEFCDGLKRVQGQARAVDMVVLQNATEKVMRECKAIRQALDARQLRFQRKTPPTVSPVPNVRSSL